jgi:hypothetical protein
VIISATGMLSTNPAGTTIAGCPVRFVIVTLSLLDGAKKTSIESNSMFNWWSSSVRTRWAQM